MCRLFGFISIKPSNAKEFLIDSECSLYTQSYINKNSKQSDGWGIAYYKGTKPIVYKSINPIYNEKDKFLNVLNKISSRIILAHIRKASNPKRLPIEKLLTIENVQPFYYKNYVFIHNGTINIPDCVISELGNYKKMVKSLNDSETYFWYIIKKLEEEKLNLVEALIDFEEFLWDKWNSISIKEFKNPYSSLNSIFTDGKKVYAICKYNEGNGTSLCFKDQPYFEMCYKVNKEFLIISSEKIDNSGEWKALKNNEFLIAQIIDKEIVFQVDKIF
ncbi:MAG: class II glutamine amidotransferase [Nitrososphaerota archaeon]